VSRTVLKAAGLALLGLVALWAFASYLEPGFTGERAAELLRCN
jgi:hypothetical protein